MDFAAYFWLSRLFQMAAAAGTVPVRLHEEEDHADNWPDAKGAKEENPPPDELIDEFVEGISPAAGYRVRRAARWVLGIGWRR